MPEPKKPESPKPRITEDGDHIVVNGVRIRRGEHSHPEFNQQKALQ